MRTNSFRLEHREFPAKIEDLESMIIWIRSKVQGTIAKETDLKKVELAMEEALVNVIHYAYPKPSKKALLEIVIHQLDDQTLEFKIIDKGLPFNPLLQPPKPNPLPPEEREEGGLGILFIRKFMDEVHYERQHPFNILTLIKRP
jgi:anti-sigma regulatory factor (Ser/Thr protein kinase)